MRIEAQRKLFVGVRIDNKMRDQLAQCPARDKMYVDGSDERYLRVLRSESDSYLGKIADAGAAASTMEDLKRNILSILLRVAPGRHREDSVKIFAVDDGDPPPLETADTESNNDGPSSRTLY